MNVANGLPAVVTPAKDPSAPALAGWIAASRALLEPHGAVLFRGFDVGTPEQFEQVARAIDPELKNDYLGTSPRDALTRYVFSASELPPYYPIPQHCEMSFLRSPPRRLMFCCLVPSQGIGGETPLADFRAVYRDLDPEVRARFETRGVRYVRNYVGPGGGPRFDPWKLKRWDEMFRTTDRARVEEKCREQGLTPEWRDGRLRLTNQHPAVREHPRTGEKTWFNHAQVFHTSAAAGEYLRIARRQGRARFRLLAGFARAALFGQQALGAEKALDCSYGDGSPISDADMERVRDAIWKNLVAFRWEKGDVLAIDNFAVSHGRMPYQGPRKVAVAWA